MLIVVIYGDRNELVLAVLGEHAVTLRGEKWNEINFFCSTRRTKAIQGKIVCEIIA